MSQLYKFYLAILLLWLSHLSYAQDTITYFNKVMEIVCCRDSASFYRIGVNDHGIFQDSIKDYYITGELFQVGLYPKWGGQGEFTGYYKNGQKSYTSTLMNNETNLINVWDTTGVKMLKRGNGVSIMYYIYNMGVMGKGNYKAGLREGYWVWNNFAGKKIEECVFGKQEKVISWNAWDDTGEKQIITNGNGVIKRYYTNGKLKYSEELKNNKFEGKYFSYFENGNMKFEGAFKNGKREGVWKWYYNNGVCYFEITYLDGVIHGPEIIRKSNDVIILKGQYNFGNKWGNWEWFTDEGLPLYNFRYN